MIQNTAAATGPTTHTPESRITLPPVPLPSFFEESIDVFPVSPSPNGSINQAQIDILAVLQDNALTSTPSANLHDNILATSATIEPNQPLSTPTKSLKDRLLEAEERGGPLGNIHTNTRSPLDKYTKTTMPPINYAHPTAILDHIDVNLVGDWENLPKGKLLAQPFGPDARLPEKHPQLKTLLFAAVVEITGSRDVSVCAPRAKPNSNRTPFSFLIYNVSEQQAQTLLNRRVWSSTAITFSVSTLNPGCPRYLFSIKGLTTMDEDEVQRVINQAWRDPDSLNLLQAICQSIPEILRDQMTRTLEYFINSLEVSRLDTKLRGGTIAPIFNMYAKSPLISDDSIWSQIRSYYARRTYAPQAQDPGINIVAPFRCGICHAADHPRGLCPFPIIEGWNGPKRREAPGVLGGAGPGPGPDGQK